MEPRRTTFMSDEYAWDYIKQYLKPDGWGQDGPFTSDHMKFAIRTIDEAVFRLKGLEK